jgi:hypothetical protein
MKTPDFSRIEQRARRILYRKLGGHDFDGMRAYLHDMKDLMAYKKDKLKESHKEEMEQFPKGVELTEYVYAKHYANYDKHCVSILHNSTYVLAYALFETRLKDLCTFAANKHHIAMDEQSLLKDNTVARAANFLREKFSLKPAAVSPYWATLAKHTELRNRIAHHHGTIQASNDTLTEFARKNKHIRLLKLRNKKNIRPFEITDRLFIHFFLQLAEDYMLWILMRIIATKKQRALLDKEDDKELILFQNRRKRMEAHKRVQGHYRKARVKKPKTK